MKIFTAADIRYIDRYTIDNEPVRSIDLMERAAGALLEWISGNCSKGKDYVVFTGPGNNGGDGLALARMMDAAGFKVKVYYISFTDNTSPDWEINQRRLIKEGIAFYIVKEANELPLLSGDYVVIDAVFGTGLSRKLEGLAADAVKHINSSSAEVISVDMPSGLFSEDNRSNDSEAIVRADITLTLQFPKVSFFMADNYPFIMEYHVLPIGLHPRAIREKDTIFNLINKSLVASMLKSFNRFDHKGHNGHGLLVAGSCGKTGASVMAARAALRTGLGLLTTHVPRPAADVIHTAVPEAMVVCDQSEILISELYDMERYNAVGAGPGIGTKPNTVKAVEQLLNEYDGPLVLDADALNIIAAKPSLLSGLKKNTVLTPHPGEFDRLVGKSGSAYERLEKQQQLSSSTGCVIVLKGANTSVVLPDGRTWFNTSGNPGMATAGSGDVLTGMLLGLLAQGYSPADASIIGVYIHGLAGDIAAGETGYEALIASDIINNIGKSFLKIRN